MLRGLYTSYTGMRAQQNKMNVISNNLANVNTTGFKKDGTIIESFDEVFALKVNDPESAGTRKIGNMTLGARVAENYTNFEQGSFRNTGNPLNIALEGKGMVAIGKYDGDGNLTTHYTRDGSFGLNPNGQLVTKDGYFVMGANGPITMKDGYVINGNGTIYSDGKFIDQIQLTEFEDYKQLKKLGSGVFEANSDAKLKPFAGKVIQGFVESSNVNSVYEMVNMINVMRTFESNQKVLSTYDATLDKSVNELGRV